jgi:hypothetical protein
MSFNSTTPLVTGHVANGEKVDIEALNVDLRSAVENTEINAFHGDQGLRYKESSYSGWLGDLGSIWKTKSEVATVLMKLGTRQGLDVRSCRCRHI